MNFAHLAIFHAVAQEKSVSRGADRLMISQPAVSKQLRTFEKSLGAALFDRTPRGVRLTEAGEVLADYATQIFALENNALKALAELKGLSRGRLAIGASTTIGVYLLPEIFVKFRQEYPGIDATLDVSSSETIAQRVADGSLDMGLIESPPPGGACDAEQFMSDDLVAIVGRGHALLKKRRVSAEMFCREPFVVRSTGSDTRSFVERELAARGLMPRVAMTLPSTEAIKRAVAAGIGVAIVSHFCIGMELKLNKLAVVRVTGLAIHRSFYRICRRGTNATRGVVKFLELLGPNDDARRAHARGDG